MTYRTFFQKTTKDLLVSGIIAFLLMSIPELILPGIVSVHFSPKYLLVIIIVLGWLHAWQKKETRPEESSKFRAVSRNILNVILFLITILLVLSLYKMKLWQIAVVTFFSVGLVAAAEKMLISEEAEK